MFTNKQERSYLDLHSFLAAPAAKRGLLVAVHELKPCFAAATLAYQAADSPAMWPELTANPKVPPGRRTLHVLWYSHMRLAPAIG
jgi:hypothetical protein